MGTLDGLQDALDVLGFFWDGADLINAVISLCRGEPKEALSYLSGLCYTVDRFLPGEWREMAEIRG